MTAALNQKSGGISPPYIAALQALQNCRDLHQAGTRAKKALILVEDSWKSLWLGTTSKQGIMLSWGHFGGDSPEDTLVPDCLSLRLVWALWKRNMGTHYLEKVCKHHQVNLNLPPQSALTMWLAKGKVTWKVFKEKAVPFHTTYPTALKNPKYFQEFFGLHHFR